MKTVVVVVGKTKGAVGEAIGEYEAGARRYFAFELHEVTEEQSRGDATRSLCDSTKAAKFECPTSTQQEMIDVSDDHG
jgi:23S rRNA pseudoU1915 N3-methylase RlmH